VTGARAPTDETVSKSLRLDRNCETTTGSRLKADVAVDCLKGLHVTSRAESTGDAGLATPPIPSPPVS